MTTAARKLSEPRWSAVIRTGHTIAEDLCHRGETVGPRSGDFSRTHGEKEDYVLRRVLVAWREEKQLAVPLRVVAQNDEPGEPDFLTQWPDGSVVGLEVTEAGNEEHQRRMTKEEQAPGSQPTRGAFGELTNDTVADLVRAIRRKNENFDRGSYRDTVCELAVYDNTEWGGFLDKEDVVRNVARSNDLSGRFSKVHIVFGSDVFLDVFGSSARRVSLLKHYESDYAGWIFNQAGRLRAGEALGPDGEHLAEEVEDLGRSERRALESHLQNLMLHLLKWQYQPNRRNSSWESSIRKSRKLAQKLLSENPSLAASFEDLVTDTYANAREDAADETGIEITMFPTSCPYCAAELRALGFLPEAASSQGTEKPRRQAVKARRQVRKVIVRRKQP